MFLSMLLALFTLQRPETLVATGVLCALYGLGRSDLSRVDSWQLSVTISLSLALMVVVLLGQRANPTVIFYLFSTISALYAAKCFGKLPIAHVRLCLEITFWLAILGIAVGLAMHWGENEPLGAIIPGSSTNGIPSYLIVLQVALAISVFLERRRLPLLSALATLIVAIIGLGRGSILVSAMIVGLTGIVNVFSNRRIRYYRSCGGGLIFLVAAVFGLGVFYALQEGAINSLTVGTKWAWGLVDPPRAKMLEDYLGKLDWWTVWFGADYSGTSIELKYLENPHNSYIRLHSYFGFLGVLLVVTSPLLILMSKKSVHVRSVVFLLISLVLVRAGTEPILFPTALDFLYFLYFAMYWHHPDQKPAPVRV